MRHRVAVAMLVFLAFAARGHDGLDLSVPSKAMASTGFAAPGAEAPFKTRRDPLPELLLRQEATRSRHAGCDAAANDVCYDLAEGRVVYRPARAWMPAFQGLKAESVSLRRDRLLLRYSFR